MLRHFAPVAFLAFTLMLSILPARPAWSKPVIEVVFVLDTTGSMGPLIEGAKRKIWSIATTLIDCSPDAEIRMGLVAYRDIGDDYVTKTFNLTTDIQGLYADLLELRARGGGDWPESVNEALHIGVTKMNWSRGRDTTRIIFLVGDAPPHMDYAQDMKYPDVMRLARARDITVNTVQAGSARDTERYWREIAQMGRGEYMAIPQDGGKIVVIETPYDREIIELQGRINRTVVPYGSQTQQRGVRERVHAGTVGAGAGRLRHGGLYVEARGTPRTGGRSDHRRRRPGRRRRQRTAVAVGAAGGAIARRPAPDVARRTAGAHRPADERAPHAQRAAYRARGPARPPHRRHPQQGAAADDGFLRPGGRAHAALADRALRATGRPRGRPS